MLRILAGCWWLVRVLRLLDGHFYGLKRMDGGLEEEDSVFMICLGIIGFNEFNDTIRYKLV